MEREGPIICELLGGDYRLDGNQVALEVQVVINSRTVDYALVGPTLSHDRKSSSFSEGVGRTLELNRRNSTV